MDPDAARRYFERVVEENAFYDWLGLRPVTLEEGRVVGELPFAERLAPPSPPAPPAIHGGAIATLVDLSAIAAVFTALEGRRGVTTTGLDISFREAVQATLRADARVEGIDGRTADVDVTVAPTDGEGTVATGEVTCRLLDGD